MPIFSIHANVESDLVTHLRPSELSKRPWGVTLQCTRCQEVHGSMVRIDPAEEVDADGGGTANFVQACRGCKQQMRVICVLPTAKEIDEWVWSERKPGAPLAKFDLRGCELATVLPEGWWVALNEDNDLSWRFHWKAGEDWSEYEEALSGVATISSIALVAKRC